MIVLEELKPILEPLLEGREDSTEVIEQVMAIDKDVAPDQAELDRVNSEWQAKYDTALADAAKDKEDTIKKMFFGSKAEEVDTSIPDGMSEQSFDGKSEDEDGEIDMDTITIDDLFEKEIVK